MMVGGPRRGYDSDIPSAAVRQDDRYCGKPFESANPWDLSRFHGENARRDRKIVFQRIVLKDTYQEIATRNDLTVERIRQIVLRYKSRNFFDAAEWEKEQARDSLESPKVQGALKRVLRREAEILEPILDNLKEWVGVVEESRRMFTLKR